MVLRRVVPVLAVVLVAVTMAATPPAATAGRRYLDRVFADVSVTADITYGAAPDETGATQSLELDLYEPAGDTATGRPLIVLAHGGSWVMGSKQSMTVLATAYARRGFVAASVEYRMDEAAGAIGYPPPPAEADRVVAAKHDLQAAVRWLRAHAADHRIDPDAIAVGGISAGAVTAVLAATTPDDPGSSGTPGHSSRVCTAVAVMGAGDPALVDSGDAGALFIHGDQDSVVSYDRARATKDAMDAAGPAAEMVTVPGAGHSLFDPNLVEQRASEWMVEQVVERTDGCRETGIAADRAFVAAAHTDLLGRPPRTEESAQEIGRLRRGGTRAQLLARLTTSDEWLGAIVTDLYADTLGRAPDAGGLAFWVGSLRSGRYSVAQVASSFLAAEELHTRAGGTDEAWVETLYDQVLDRAGSDRDVGYWVDQTARRGRTWVARRIHGSLESRQARVAALYQHLLGRAPEAGGLAYWADRVGRDGDLALARDLALSAEYGMRALARFP